MSDSDMHGSDGDSGGGGEGEVGADYPEVETVEIPPDDEVLSTGTFEMTWPKMNTYRAPQEVRTATTMIDGFPWRFLIYPKGRNTNAVGVFVEIDHEHELFKYGASKPFTMFVFCKVEVVSSTNPKWNCGKIFRHRFHDTGKRNTGMNWGFKGLVDLDDLADAQRGYMGPNDSCTFRYRMGD